MGRDYGTKFEEYFLCMYPTKTCEELLMSAGNKTAVWHTAQSDAMECAVVDAGVVVGTGASQVGEIDLAASMRSLQPTAPYSTYCLCIDACKY